MNSLPPIGQALAPYHLAGCCAVIGLVPRALSIGFLFSFADIRFPSVMGSTLSVPILRGNKANVNLIFQNAKHLSNLGGVLNYTIEKNTPLWYD